MYQLVYTSIEAQGMTPDDLAALLSQARAKNERLDVTGMLLYRNGAFIQVLEGRDETVQRLYDTIRADKRHEDVTLLKDGPIKKRVFADWAMGFKDVADDDIERLPGFSDFLNSRNTVQQLRKLLANPSFAYEALLQFKGS